MNNNHFTRGKFIVDSLSIIKSSTRGFNSNKHHNNHCCFTRYTVKGQYLYFWRDKDCFDKLKIYDFLPDGTIILTPKFIQLWTDFKPPLTHGYNICGDNFFIMPQFPKSIMTSKRVDASGFLDFTRTFPLNVPPEDTSVISSGIALALFTANTLTIPNYRIEYNIIKLFAATVDPTEIRFYTFSITNPNLVLMVDSTGAITRYPLKLDKCERTCGCFTLIQYDNIFVYFPYDGYEVVLTVTAIPPEPISCEIPTTTYLKLKFKGCRYSIPVYTSVFSPLSVTSVPDKKFVEIAQLVGNTFTQLELPVPAAVITDLQVVNLLNIPQLNTRLNEHELNNQLNTRELNTQLNLQQTAPLVLTADNNGDFLNFTTEGTLGVGLLSNFVAGTVKLNGIVQNNAIVKRRSSTPITGWSIQPVTSAGVLIPRTSGIITITLRIPGCATCLPQGGIALFSITGTQTNIYDNGIKFYPIGPTQTIQTLVFNMPNIADVAFFVNTDNDIIPQGMQFKASIQYPIGYSLSPPYYFYSLQNGTGRDVNGTLFNNNVAVSGEAGFSTVANLNMYPLTYALGNPFYQPGTFGFINNATSWTDAIKGFPALNVSAFTPETLRQNIIIIESNILRLTSSIDVGGIVVRKGGILLIDEANILTIRVQFIIVESGGLLQAGTPRFRYNGVLNILLINDSMMSSGQMLASQYSSRVYFPGGPFPGQIDNDLKAPYTGSSMNGNHLGNKTISVGFNGNLQLCGRVPANIPYKGTWAAKTSSGANFIDETTLMTYFNGAVPSEKQRAVANNIETDYPNTWCKLLPLSGNNMYTIGMTQLTVSENVSDWPIGSKIVITCRTDSYTTNTDLNGDIPIWLDHDDSVNRAANAAANSSITWPHNYGVEVATIASVSGNTITIREGLRFNHNSTTTPVTRTINGVAETIQVETFLHVGLLTRNILVTPEYNRDPNGMGCNVPCTNAADISMCTACNYDNMTGGEVYAICYASRNSIPAANANAKYCGNTNPSAVSGHWLFGSSGLTGCNAISGGQMMFRYGSSIHLDGIELKYMGLPANFGTIGQYAMHFHLAGFAKAFTGYLPSTQFTRESTVINCANWCSYNRWVTLHGTHESDIKNNIGFVCMGSGYFVEDGIEVNNTFEHNMAICTLPARFNAYYNPIPIYPNVSSDLCFSSAFWFKNNKNRCLRNISCNSPQPVIAIWGVPQNIGRLRGPAAICLGDASLGLPGIIGYSNAVGTNQSFLSQNLNNNPNGCWMPDNFKLLLYADTNLCTACSTSNDTIPYLLYAENVVYQMAAGMSEFPEALADALPDFNGFDGAIGCGMLQLQKGHAQFMPANGQNLCTDGRNVAQTTYFQTTWGSGSPTYPYQPISLAELAQLDIIGATTNQTSKSANIPKIFSGFLTYNLGPSANTLWGGSGWTKLTPSWLISCCMLQVGGGTTVGQSTPNPDNPLTATANYPKAASSLWSTVCGDAVNQYPNIYHVLYNHITDGALGIPPNPTIMGGDKMFISDTALPAAVEYVALINGLSVNVANVYFMDNNWQNISPQFWTKGKIIGGGIGPGDDIYYGLFNFSDNIWAVQHGTSAPRVVGAFESGQTTPSLVSRKYPYVSGPDFNLLTSNDEFTAANPQWGGIVVNSQAGTFINAFGIALGNKLCRFLSYIPICSQGPWQRSGDQPQPSRFGPVMPSTCTSQRLISANVSGVCMAPVARKRLIPFFRVDK